MKKIYILLFAIAGLSTQAAFAQLDNTFSGDGRTWTSFGAFSEGISMIIQPADQYIVEAGSYGAGTFSGAAVVRFTKDGGIDSSFGSLGIAELPFTNAGGNISVGIQSNGSIIVCYQTAVGNQQYPILVRLTKFGQIDYGFSATGNIAFPALLRSYSLLVQTDDKILIGSYNGVIARCTKDGALDGTFGHAGLFTLPNLGTDFSAMAFMSDHSIVAVGMGHTAYQMVHVSTVGVLDNQFGTSGISTITVGGTDPIRIQGVTVIPGDYIILSGSYQPAIANPTWRYLICKLDGLGHFFPGFAGNGKLGIPFANANAFGQGSIQLQEGQLMMTGYVETVKSGPVKVGMCRITANGAIDYTYSSSGIDTVGWRPSATGVEGLNIAFQGTKIVVGGNLLSSGFMAMRFLSPVILPPPPIVDASTAGLQSTSAATSIPLRLYPNPTGQTLNIQGLDPDANTALQITDAAGQAMLTAQTHNQSTFSLDVSRLPAGTYFVTLATAAHRKTLTFVKTR